jgi:hypothetical protein
MQLTKKRFDGIRTLIIISEVIASLYGGGKFFQVFPSRLQDTCWGFGFVHPKQLLRKRRKAKHEAG